MGKKIVVLHSGGLEATVCVLLAKSRGHEVISLGIEYGQRHHIELDYAAAQCQKFGIERKSIRVAWDKPDRVLPKNRRVEDMRGNVSPAFLPGRNGVFLMLACAEAAGLKANEVWTGINSVDFSGYPDCTPEFVSSFQTMLKYAIPKGPKLVAPLQLKSKPQIARLGAKLGLKQGDTWSCYRPKIVPAGLIPCNECDACVLHNFAWNPALS